MKFTRRSQLIAIIRYFLFHNKLFKVPLVKVTLFLQLQSLKFSPTKIEASEQWTIRLKRDILNNAYIFANYFIFRSRRSTEYDMSYVFATLSSKFYQEESWNDVMDRRKKMGGRGRIGASAVRREFLPVSRVLRKIDGTPEDTRALIHRFPTLLSAHFLPAASVGAARVYSLDSLGSKSGWSNGERGGNVSSRGVKRSSIRSSISPRIRRIKFKRSLSKSTLDQSSPPRGWKSACNEPRNAQLPQKPFLHRLDILHILFFLTV